MTATPTAPPRLHLKTPLIESPALTALCNRRVLLKLDNLQPSGSFKIRGHGHLVQTHAAAGITHFISSSGGNAGAAVAEAGRLVGARVTIVLPSSTPNFMLQRLKAAGAEVRVEGSVWDEADAVARKLAHADEHAVHVSPFDDPLLWQGHASLVTELAADLSEPPAAVAVSVGGGGLLLGTVTGLRDAKWAHVPIIAAETIGADSLSKALQAGQIVRLPEISSIAKSLGALAVSQSCMDVVSEGAKIMSQVVSDREAVEACSFLATKHRFLVEPACGAAIAAAIHAAPKLPVGDAPIVVVVCGGNMASPALLADWMAATGAKEATL